MPFHKLTQWLCYSLMAPMKKLLNIHFAGEELLTGLPEYRNGGLLIDTGLLTLKEADGRRGLEAYRRNAMLEGQPNVEVVPLFNASDDVIVEWRALTVGFLDELLGEVNRMLGLTAARGDALTLAQMLEAGTWKVQYPIINVMSHTPYLVLTRETGRSRTRRSVAAKHQRTSDHDSIRWHPFLDSLPRRPNLLLFHDYKDGTWASTTSRCDRCRPPTSVYATGAFHSCQLDGVPPPSYESHLQRKDAVMGN